MLINILFVKVTPAGRHAVTPDLIPPRLFLPSFYFQNSDSWSFVFFFNTPAPLSVLWSDKVETLPAPHHHHHRGLASPSSSSSSSTPGSLPSLLTGNADLIKALGPAPNQQVQREVVFTGIWMFSSSKVLFKWACRMNNSGDGRRLLFVKHKNLNRKNWPLTSRLRGLDDDDKSLIRRV